MKSTYRDDHGGSHRNVNGYHGQPPEPEWLGLMRRMTAALEDIGRSLASVEAEHGAPDNSPAAVAERRRMTEWLAR